MRQFILTVGTLVAIIMSCWDLYLGISSIIKSQLGDSLYHLFVKLPLIASAAICFDYINALMHEDYRKLRRSLARKKGAQIDIENPDSSEVAQTPWEDDAAHKH